MDKLCVSKLCVNKLCVSKLCVNKLCVSKLCVDKLCVSKLCVCVGVGTSCVWEAGREEEEAEEAEARGSALQRCGEKTR